MNPAAIQGATEITAKVPTLAIVISGAFIAVILIVTWWNTKTNRDMQADFSKLRTEFTKLATGEIKITGVEIAQIKQGVIEEVNGQQDKKINEVCSVANAALEIGNKNTSEIKKIWNAVAEIKESTTLLDGSAGQIVELIEKLKSDREKDSNLKKSMIDILDRMNDKLDKNNEE